MPEPWMSTQLGVSQDRVHRWIRNRNMLAPPIGRLLMFKVSEVDEWIRHGRANEDGKSTDDNQQ